MHNCIMFYVLQFLNIMMTRIFNLKKEFEQYFTVKIKKNLVEYYTDFGCKIYDKLYLSNTQICTLFYNKM